MYANYSELQKVVNEKVALHIKKPFNSLGQEPYLNTSNTYYY